jgi:hypothetical protein
MSKAGRTDTVLWITRMDGAGENDSEVCTLGYDGDGARETFQHACRVIRSPQGSDHLKAGDLVVTLLVDGGDNSADDVDPLRVPAAQADWFLDEWLKVPKAWRSDKGRKAVRR